MRLDWRSEVIRPERSSAAKWKDARDEEAFTLVPTSPAEAPLSPHSTRYLTIRNRVSCESVVDIAWLPLLHRANVIERRTGYDFIGHRPKLKHWQQVLLTGDLAAKSVAPDFEEAFGAFYLSGETYLGRGEQL